MSSFSSLPEEIQVNIFLRLPNKSIQSCRRVCRNWGSLLFSPYFIKTRLDQAMRNPRPRLMIKSAYLGKNKCLFRSVDYASILSAASASSSGKCTCDGDIPNNYLIQDVLRKSRMLGTCNGLICMALKNLQNSEDILVWNPSTGEYKNNRCPFPTSLDYANRYGFYYDSVADDYKVVRITDNNHRYLVDVYSLGSRSWKKIQSIDDYDHPIFHKHRNIPFNRHGRLDIPFRRFISAYFVNGAFHWLGVNTKLGSRVIVSLDVSSERFADILFPEDAQITDRGDVLDYVGVLENCLSLCTYHHRYNHRIDIWLMQEYGVADSWTKRFSFSTKDICVDIHRLKPLWSFRNGELLIDTGKEKLLYEPKKNSFRVLKIDNGGSGINCRGSIPLNYVESLVSPN